MTWPGGGFPHFASVVLGRVAQVTDQSSDPSLGAPFETGIDATDEELGVDTEQVQRALADARSRLLEVPAEVVVTNHVMGLYELAAIHLSSDPPDLVAAALAIDAVACLVDGLGDRLGEDAATMRDALATIRMAFVQVKTATGQSAPGDD